VDIAGAVEDAKKASADTVLEAVVAAEDAARDRDEVACRAAAARAEAMAAAKSVRGKANAKSELETKAALASA